MSRDSSGQAESDYDYDVLVIGSGFGGSVTALRLTEKGYRVGVLETGRRFADDEFAKTSWRLRKYLWAPRLGCCCTCSRGATWQTFNAAEALAGCARVASARS